jgi:hypothetical protein
MSETANLRKIAHILLAVKLVTSEKTLPMCPRMIELFYREPDVSASFRGNKYHNFLKFLQYREFLAYVTTEQSSLHEDFR